MGLPPGLTAAPPVGPRRASPHWHSAPRRPVRARAVPLPRRRAGTLAHCSPGHPGRRSALGAWRGPAVICIRSSHKGSRSGAPGRRAPPGPGAILRPGGGNSSPPAPGPPLRVNGRAPPPSEALCVSARPAGPARDVPARPAAPPRQRPSPMLISLAAGPGRRPGWEPLTFPRGPKSPARPPAPTLQPSLPGAFHPSYQESPPWLPGAPRPWESGWPGSLGPRSCSDWAR